MNCWKVLNEKKCRKPRKETEKRRAKDIFHISCLIELTYKKEREREREMEGWCWLEDDEAR